MFARVYKRAEHELFLHSACVVARVAGGRHVGGELGEVRYPAHGVELAPVLEFGAHRLDVDGLVFGVEREHRAINDAVLLGVERVWRKYVAGLEHALRAYHKRAQKSLFSFQSLRRHA
ncbi:MAG: hypothetical protein UX77_C0041G0004 [Parcubacteria group bacterium GW2011_GWA1_47_11]|nr:MAG: hypothetical protein UX77_C0041G0004 [Parcubacteria group bacterium GW2011_GWA1_47_11]